MPDKKRYARIKAQKKADAAWQARKLATHEQDIVMAVFYLRQRVQKLSKVMERDLHLMTGHNAVFVMHSAEEMAGILATKKMIDAMIIANEARSAGFERMVLKRVEHLEAVVAAEKDGNAK